MARPVDVAASAQAARLLRIGQARDARTRAEAAIAAAARQAAERALEAALAARREVGQAVEQTARGRWDATAGAVLTAASLSMLRDAEAAGRDAVGRAHEAVAAAERASAAAAQAAAAAAKAVAAQATACLRRERLAAVCAARLRRRLLRDEDAALEDGHGHRNPGMA